MRLPAPPLLISQLLVQVRVYAAFAEPLIPTFIGDAFSVMETNPSLKALIDNTGVDGPVTTALPLVTVAVLVLAKESLNVVLNENVPFVEAITKTVAVPEAVKLPVVEAPPAATVPPLTTTQLLEHVIVYAALGSPLSIVVNPVEIFSAAFTTPSESTDTVTTGANGNCVSVEIDDDAP